MKKLLSLLLLAALLLTALTPALAAQVVSSAEIPAYDAIPGRTTMMIQDPETRAYKIYDSSLKPISGSSYADVDSDREAQEAGYYIVSDGGELYDLNLWGVVDEAGNQIIPCQYSKIEGVGKFWFLCFTLTPATIDNYDFEVRYWGGNKEKEYYQSAAIDVYIDKTKAGTLSRTDYDYADLQGSFLKIKTKAGDYLYFEPRTGQGRRADESIEYSYDYSANKVTHNPTGVPAFEAGCNLQPSEVEQFLYEKKSVVYDLQGNPVFNWESSDSLGYFKNEVAYFTNNATRKRGIINYKGEIIYPAQFDEYPNCDQLAKVGAMAASLDGKFVSAGIDGNLVFETKYAYNSVRTKNDWWCTIQDLEGRYHVLSVLSGELSETADDVTASGAFVRLEDKATKLGNVYAADGSLITEGTNYGLYASTDNRLVACSLPERATYRLMLVAEGNAAQPVIDTEPLDGGNSMKNLLEGLVIPSLSDVLQTPAPTEAAPAADGWTCPTCGNANTGKFCPECGTARPQPVTCSNCGYTPADGKAFKFCPECGTPAK